MKFVGEERFVVQEIPSSKILLSIDLHLNLKYVDVHRFISLSNENFQSVLPFASLWAKLDLHTPSSEAYDIHTNSFYSNVVNRYITILLPFES